MYYLYYVLFNILQGMN